MDFERFDLAPQEEEGHWFNSIDFRTGEEVKDAKVKVAADDCTGYTEAVEKFADSIFDSMTSRPGARQSKAAKNTGAIRRKVNLDAAAKYIFLDFQGFKRDGKPLQNSEQIRRELLESPRFLQMILKFAEEIKDLREEELGNSPSSPEKPSG